MKRIANLVVIVGLVAGVAGCERASEGTDKKLDEVLARLDTMEKKIDTRPTGAMGAAGLQAGAQPQRPQPPRPDPNTVYAVPVDDHDPTTGAKFAKVTIVEGYDYACPYCMMTSDVVDKIVAARGSDVKYVGKQFVVHPQVATTPALAACAAARQGKFGEMSTAIWKSAWSSDGKLTQDKLSADAMKQLAGAHGLDVAKFTADMNGDECKNEIQQDQRELAAVGVNGTPAFFINGKPYQGPRTLEGFNAAIDAEIAKADAAIKAGVKIEDYYASIIKAGKKSI